MPSEQHSSSYPHSQSRPALGEHRSSTSIHSGSPSATPPKHTTKQKTHKHVAHGGRIHTRVPSGKSLHKLTRAHGQGEGSHTDLKKLGKNSSSTTSLPKSGSHVSLKRNRLSADHLKQDKGKAIHEGHKKRPASVHFEIGDQDDAWEEASSSASPALSRSASRSAQSSAKPSANNSEPQSPAQSPTSRSKEPPAGNITDDKLGETGLKNTADAKVITQRLLQRIPSHSTTQMTLDTVQRTGSSPSGAELGKSHNSTLNSAPKDGSKEEVVSRFVGGSGTPSENSPFLQLRKTPKVSTGGSSESKQEAVKRTKSDGNLSRDNTATSTKTRAAPEPEEEESALAPRSRKSSTGAGPNAYNPYLDSRTQQKLWLQRASSNIEPQQLTPGATISGAGLDGVSRDPRTKIQLERTGLEYLVVRRHQDPVGAGLKRLVMLPGAERIRRIPLVRQQNGNAGGKKGDAAAGRFGLSGSVKEGRGQPKDKGAGGGIETAGRTSFEGNLDEGSDGRPNGEDADVGSLLRSLWEKSCDLSASA